MNELETADVYSNIITKCSFVFLLDFKIFKANFLVVIHQLSKCKPYDFFL